jgi:BRCT domain type II-containing protein
VLERIRVTVIRHHTRELREPHAPCSASAVTAKAGSCTTTAATKRRRSLHQHVALDAGLREHYRLELAARIEVHLVDADHAMIPIVIAERAPVVDDVPSLGARRMQHGVVAGTRCHPWILLEDLADSLERSKR